MHVEKKCALYTWENPPLICMGKPTVGMPTHKMRILCMGKNAHNICGKTHAYYAWANPRWECPGIKCAFLPTHKMRILCVGFPMSHVPRSSHVKPMHIIRGQKCCANWGYVKGCAVVICCSTCFASHLYSIKIRYMFMLLCSITNDVPLFQIIAVKHMVQMYKVMR